MDLVKRFLKYVSFETTSSEHSELTPSTACQLQLARYLVNELKSIGVEEVLLDQYGIVYGKISSNCAEKKPTIGFIAHMDTSPDCSGKNIRPRIIKNYDGKDILLNEEKQISLLLTEFPFLKDLVHEELIVTDGTTLLGADDKAGIAIIVEMCQQIIKNKNWKHGEIRIAFTPDEEVGRGTEHFDVSFFHCDFAYTIDGGDIRAISYENFNACSVHVDLKGISIHPGDAKGKMVNACLLASEFDRLLPAQELPSLTEGYEGFHHLTHMEGEVEQASLDYIVRNHNEQILLRQKNDFLLAAEQINQKIGYQAVTVTIKDGYKNMKPVIEQKEEVLKRVTKAYDQLQYPYYFEPIRGGTDGANLSFMGLPCPNLGTGGYNFHGRYELVSVTQMRKMVKILCEILKN